MLHLVASFEDLKHGNDQSCETSRKKSRQITTKCIPIGSVRLHRQKNVVERSTADLIFTNRKYIESSKQTQWRGKKIECGIFLTLSF